MKKYILSLGLVAGLLVFGQTSAQAADWYYAGLVDGEAIYVDNSRVVKNDAEATVWVRAIEADGEMEDTRLYVNRNGYYTRELETIEYNRYGQVVEHEMQSDDADRIESDDWEALVYKLIW